MTLAEAFAQEGSQSLASRAVLGMGVLPCPFSFPPTVLNQSYFFCFVFVFFFFQKISWIFEFCSVNFSEFLCVLDFP